MSTQPYTYTRIGNTVTILGNGTEVELGETATVRFEEELKLARNAHDSRFIDTVISTICFLYLSAASNHNNIQRVGVRSSKPLLG